MKDWTELCLSQDLSKTLSCQPAPTNACILSALEQIRFRYGTVRCWEACPYAPFTADFLSGHFRQYHGVSRRRVPDNSRNQGSLLARGLSLGHAGTRLPSS